MAIPFDIDGNGIIQAFGDCLLIIRYVLGYRGDLLIADVVGAGATRTTAAEIEGYLSNMYCFFDVDGDGIVSYGDANMIFKYKAGFRGNDLIGDSLPAGAVRSTAAEIEAYIAQFLVDV
jgi:hypothetical protein